MKGSPTHLSSFSPEEVETADVIPGKTPLHQQISLYNLRLDISYLLVRKGSFDTGLCVSFALT